jgi:hypothetical protein
MQLGVVVILECDEAIMDGHGDFVCRSLGVLQCTDAGCGTAPAACALQRAARRFECGLGIVALGLDSIVLRGDACCWLDAMLHGDGTAPL